MTPEEELAASRRLHWMSILELHAISRGDQDALVGEERRLTWRDVRNQVRAVSAELQRRGVNVGDRVFILSLNSVEYVIALLAINTVGAIACPLNSRSVSAELDYFVDDSGAVFGFVDDLGAAVRERSGIASEVSVICFGEEFQAIAESGAQPEAVDVAETDDAFIIYTSGTTSAPKGVLLTHMNMISQALNTTRTAPSGAPTDCNMVVVPLFHIAGLAFLYPCFLNGVKVVIAPPKALASMESLADLLETERLPISSSCPPCGRHCARHQVYATETSNSRGYPGVLRRRAGRPCSSWQTPSPTLTSAQPSGRPRCHRRPAHCLARTPCGRWGPSGVPSGWSRRESLTRSARM